MFGFIATFFRNRNNPPPLIKHSPPLDAVGISHRSQVKPSQGRTPKYQTTKIVAQFYPRNFQGNTSSRRQKNIQRPEIVVLI